MLKNHQRRWRTLALAAATFSAVALGTLAQAEKPDEAFVRTLIPATSLTPIKAAPMKGWVYTIADGQMVYLTNDRQFMIYGGEVYDLIQKMPVSDTLMTGHNKALLESIPEADRIIYKPENTKYSVTVYTDPNCGYCRKLHNELKDYLAAGIEVHYMATDAYGGPKSGEQLRRAWCSDDRKAGMDAIKAGKTLSTALCDSSAVDQQIAVAQQLGIRGTPAIFSNKTGLQIGGYVPAADMAQRLAGE